MHPEDRDRVDKAVKGALEGKSFSIDYRIFSADIQEERIVNACGEAVFNEENRPVRTRGTVQDITERKKAEDKAQNLANIVESSNDAIITISPDGFASSWNRGAEKLYGYLAEEILGKNLSILEPYELSGEIKKLSDLVKHGERVQQYETIRLRKGG